MHLRPLDIASQLSAGIKGVEITLDEILDDLFYPAARNSDLTGRGGAR